MFFFIFQFLIISLGYAIFLTNFCNDEYRYNETTVYYFKTRLLVNFKVLCTASPSSSAIASFEKTMCTVTRYSLLFTRYSLLVTCYFLLVNFYSLLVTFCSLFVTFYLLLLTRYSLLLSCYFLLVNCCFLLVTRYFSFVTTYSLLITFYSLFSFINFYYLLVKLWKLSDAKNLNIS